MIFCLRLAHCLADIVDTHCTFWRYKVFTDIRRGSLGRGRQMTVELLTTAISALSLAISSETLEMRPALFYGETQSVVRFSVIPKCVRHEWPWTASSSSGILLFHSRSMTPITWQAAVDDKEQRPLLQDILEAAVDDRRRRQLTSKNSGHCSKTSSKQPSMGIMSRAISR